jgi:hypothetical protein
MARLMTMTWSSDARRQNSMLMSITDSVLQCGISSKHTGRAAPNILSVCFMRMALVPCVDEMS